MSVFKRTFFCPCGTRACRLMRARRVLAVIAGIATVITVYLTTGVVI